MFREIHSSHRKVFVSVTVATLFLLIAHFTFEPLIFGDLRALDDGIYRTGNSCQKEIIPFYRYVMLLLVDRIDVCVDMTAGQQASRWA